MKKVQKILLCMIFSLLILFFDSTTSGATEYLLNRSVNDIAPLTLNDIYGNQVTVNPADGVPAVYFFGADNYEISSYHYGGILNILRKSESMSAVNFYFFGVGDSFCEQLQAHIDSGILNAKVYIFPKSTEYISFREAVGVWEFAPFAVYKNADNVLCACDGSQTLEGDYVLDSLKRIGVQVTFPCTGTVTVSGSVDYVLADQMLNSLNQERANRGLPLVTMDKDMLEYAVKRAAEYSLRGRAAIPTGAYDYLDEDTWKGNGTFVVESYDFWYADKINKENFINTWYIYEDNVLNKNVTSVGFGIFTVGNDSYGVNVLSDKNAVAAPNKDNCDTTYDIRINSSLKGSASFTTKDIQGNDVVINPTDGTPAIYLFGGISSCGYTNATLYQFGDILNKVEKDEPINIYAFDIVNNTIDDIRSFVERSHLNVKIYVFNDIKNYELFYEEIEGIARQQGTIAYSSVMPLVAYKNANNDVIVTTAGYTWETDNLLTNMEKIGVKLETKPAPQPTDEPTDNPKDEPTDNPKDEPTDNPKDEPIDNPKDEPTDNPKDEPTDNPKDEPTDNPKGEPIEIETVAMYRLYNPNSGEHFYTKSVKEKDNLSKIGWKYEGIAWYAPTTGDPIYRLYNENAGDHHYTKSAKEKDTLVKAGWKYEGIAWYSGGDKPLYRAYNPNAKAGSHHYTTSSKEIASLTKVGWKNEGVAWYGVK